MRWTQRWMIGLVVTLVFGVLVTACPALEKTAVRAGDLDSLSEWDVSTTCQVAYYNYCTGWVWAWGGWLEGDVIGVCFETCCSPGISLVGTRALVNTAAPAGRGFTGAIDLWTADENHCPASLLASQPFLPRSGWNPINWAGAVVSDLFVVTVTMAGSGHPSRFISDHPAAGPTGPQACGVCYQLHRLARSYDYGTWGALLCPGETLNDGVCNVEWVWDVTLACEDVVGAGDWSSRAGSWASVKALYR